MGYDIYKDALNPQVISHLEMLRDRYIRAGYGDLENIDGHEDLSLWLTSLERFDSFLGISSNNNPSVGLLGGESLTWYDILERRVQGEYNKEYDKRIEELNKLRIREVTTGLSESLQAPTTISDSVKSSLFSKLGLGSSVKVLETVVPTPEEPATGVSEEPAQVDEQVDALPDVDNLSDWEGADEEVSVEDDFSDWEGADESSEEGIDSDWDEVDSELEEAEEDADEGSDWDDESEEDSDWEVDESDETSDWDEESDEGSDEEDSSDDDLSAWEDESDDSLEGSSDWDDESEDDSDDTSDWDDESEEVSDDASDWGEDSDDGSEDASDWEDESDDGSDWEEDDSDETSDWDEDESSNDDDFSDWDEESESSVESTSSARVYTKPSVESQSSSTPTVRVSPKPRVVNPRPRTAVDSGFLTAVDTSNKIIDKGLGLLKKSLRK